MTEPHRYLNGLTLEQAAAALGRCCGAARWVERMNALRPFASADALYRAADALWHALSPEEQLAAFAHHPRIGERLAAASALSSREQAGVARADSHVLEALRAGNVAYEARFGFVFLVCATGKSADEMLACLKERLGHERATELRIAADEHAKITRIRLGGLGA